MKTVTSLDMEEVEDALDILNTIMNVKEADYVENNMTPVMKAIQQDSEDLLKKLLDTTIDLEATDDEGNTAVMWAIKKNKPRYLQMLMDKSASPNVSNYEGVFALHKAVESCNEELVDILCQAGANVNVFDYNGETPAHYAVFYGNISILRTLIEYKTDVSVVDNKGITALFIAVWKDNSDIIRLLLENSADVNIDKTVGIKFYQHVNSEVEEVTPAMYAAAMGYVEGLELLIHFGADPHMRHNTHKRSALFYASLYKYKECVDVILRKSNIEKALIDASKKGHTDYVRLLLEFKPNLESVDEVGETAVTKAAGNQHTETLETLLEAGAQVDPELGCQNSKSPLMSAAFGGNADHVKIILDRKAWIDRVNGNKETALWFAAHSGNIRCLQILLEAGADASLASITGTPLMAATCDLMCLKALLEHGCETNYKNDKGECAVTFAVTHWSDENINVLIKYNADINTVDCNERSPVMLATSKNKYRILNALLSNGAQINHADNIGTTALHIAAQKGFHTCMELLLSYGPNLNPIMRKTRRCMPWTPVMCAIKRNSKRCLLLLLKHGAHASVPDSAGLKTAMIRGFAPQLIKVLHAAGANPDYLPDLVYNGDNERNIPLWQQRHQQPNYPTDLHDQDHDKSLFNICRLNIRKHLLKMQPKNLFSHSSIAATSKYY